MNIILDSIAIVNNSRTEKLDTKWSEIISEIVLNDKFSEESLEGIDTFSHLEIIYYFHKANKDKVINGKHYPRENKNWPKVGIFAQRKKDRPNHIGLAIVNLVKKEGKKLIVKNLDAIDGTPVLDIKPVYKEYLAKHKINQPKWVNEMMEKYW